MIAIRTAAGCRPACQTVLTLKEWRRAHRHFFRDLFFISYQQLILFFFQINLWHFFKDRYSSSKPFPTQTESCFFLRKLLRWVLISMSQSLSREPCLKDEPARQCWAMVRARGWTSCATIHFFFWAFSAAFVVFPLTSLVSTALMTPTATVCLMSRTAKRPGDNKVRMRNEL